MHIRDIGRETGLGEITLAAAKAGKVESQYRDTAGRQHATDTEDRDRVLGAGKAMTGNGECTGCAGRQLKPGIQPITAAAREFSFYRLHVQGLPIAA